MPVVSWSEAPGVGRSAQALLRSVLMRLMEFSTLASENFRDLLPNIALFSLHEPQRLSDVRWTGFIPADALLDLEEQYWSSYGERMSDSDTGALDGQTRELVRRATLHTGR